MTVALLLLLFAVVVVDVDDGAERIATPTPTCQLGAARRSSVGGNTEPACLGGSGSGSAFLADASECNT